MSKEINVTEYCTENFAELRKKKSTKPLQENDKGLTSKEPLKSTKELPNGK